MKFIKSYCALLLTFLLVDIIWITAFAGEFYQQQLGDLLKTNPDLSMVGVFYLCYAAGVVYLVVMKASNYSQSILGGAVFGALAYGTFTITNYSLIEGWTMPVLISDVSWGAFITALSAAAGFHFYKDKPT